MAATDLLRAGVVLAAVLVPAAASACAEDRIRFLTDSGEAVFEIELARTPDEQARGLMFRPSLAPGTGMLFVYESPRVATFWMKNTMIPLDMVFITDAGTVHRVEARAEPYSTVSRSSGAPVRAVLEIGGGRAEALGIGPGTRAIHPAFESAPEEHRCAPAD